MSQAANQSQFFLSVDDVKFLVVSFSATEMMSMPFTIDLHLASEDDVPMDSVLGNVGLLEIGGDRADEEDRFFHGIISEFRRAEIRGRFYIYHARMVPDLWKLSLHRDCRIFQELSAPDIIKEVLKAAGIPDDSVDFRLTGKHETREYCVQYRETDLDFISRLMEEEGIFYFFDHQKDKHLLIFGDDAGVYPPIAENDTIEFHPDSGMVTGDYFVRSFDLGQQLHTGKVVLTDYNYLKPSQNLTCEKEEPKSYPMKVFDYPGNYNDKSPGDNMAKVRLEELVTFKEKAEGMSNCPFFSAGRTFKLSGHDREELDKAYLLVKVQHTGEQPQVLGEQSATDQGLSYRNEVLAIPSEVIFRPPRRTPRACVKGIQTAVVMGPKDEEIYTDEHGRVKVKFHWDHADIDNEKRTCWVRVSQSMAGLSWGSFFLPRVGHEVIVDFIEGDPDRPIVTGQVYNGSNPPPHPLPDHQTFSGIKTNSSPDGEGFNEVRLEDKKGEEQIFIHAEKNMDLRIKNDRFETVIQNRHLLVENDKKEEVKNNRHETVGNDHKEEIGKDRHLNVKGMEAKQIAKSLSLTVQGDVSDVFKGKHSEQTTGDYYLKAQNIVLEGIQNITLCVGSSHIAIEPASIEIETAGEIKIKGSKFDVSGGALAEIKAGIVKIN